jgi:histidine triad (HIT) family protein
MSVLIPLHRLRETGALMAFHHPQPRYPLHILILPKREIASLLEITSADQQFLMDLFACVRELVIEFELEEKGYRLIANGGAFQDFPHLHFHLITE